MALWTCNDNRYGWSASKALLQTQIGMCFSHDDGGILLHDLGQAHSNQPGTVGWLKIGYQAAHPISDY